MSLRSLLARWSTRKRQRAAGQAGGRPATRPPHASPAEAWGRGGGPIDPGFGG